MTRNPDNRSRWAGDCKCKRLGDWKGFHHPLCDQADEPKRCLHCDGTGDVHRADGEWLGECTACDTNEAASQPKALTDEKIDAAILEWFSFERDQDDFRARMRAAIIAATEAK